MPGTKPIGPYQGVFKLESTAFTFEEWAVTDTVRMLGVPDIGEAKRTREFVQVSRPDRGRFHRKTGRFEDVTFSIPIQLVGSGTAGTKVAARGALFEAAGLTETVSGGTSVTYDTSTLNPAKTMSAYIVDRNAVKGEYLIGAIVETVTIDIDKDSLDTPTVTFAGMAARKWEFTKTTLNGAIADGVTTSMTLTDTTCITTGDESTSVSGLAIYAQIEDEIVKITAYNWSTGVATITRGEFSTTPAAHADTTAVTPVKQTLTYEAGLLLGPEDVTLADDAGAVCIRSAQITINTGRRFDPLQTCNSSSNAVNNGPIEVGGSISAIHSTSIMPYNRYLDAHTNRDLAFTIGSTAGSIFTINLDAIEVTTKSVSRAFDDIETVDYEFVSLDSATALRPAFEIVET